SEEGLVAAEIGAGGVRGYSLEMIRRAGCQAADGFGHRHRAAAAEIRCARGVTIIRRWPPKEINARVAARIDRSIQRGGCGQNTRGGQSRDGGCAEVSSEGQVLAEIGAEGVRGCYSNMIGREG